MTRNDITIESGGIALRNCAANDVARVKRSFATLFLVAPHVTVRGLFPDEAVRGGGELNLLNPPAPRVVAIGREYLTVDLGAPFGKRQLLPLRGHNVEVRFTLPEPRS